MNKRTYADQPPGLLDPALTFLQTEAFLHIPAQLGGHLIWELLLLSSPLFSHALSWTVLFCTLTLGTYFQYYTYNNV